MNILTPKGATTREPSSGLTSTPRKSHEESSRFDAAQPWVTMYTGRPTETKELFDLEAMVAKRMELLAWIDQMVNSTTTQNIHEVIAKVVSRLPKPQRRAASSSGASTPHRPTVLGNDEAKDEDKSTHSVSSKVSTGVVMEFTDEEDLVSHLLCRFAFCTSDKWRKWFVKTEEILLRARLKDATAQRSDNAITTILKMNGLPCEAVAPSEKLTRYIEFLQSQNQGKMFGVSDFVAVPIGLATRLIKDRHALCHNGQAIILLTQVTEVCITVFKTQLAMALHETYQTRCKIEERGDHEVDCRSTLFTMVDAFLTRFIADPHDQLKEMTEGVVRPGDVPVLAQTQFPLCMRRCDTHLRSTNHLKHHGRLMYGLFLKSIGMSMEDSMLFFSSLMTVKGGGSVEAFAKSAYGYNVRHNYGKEGKKTSYSSLSCGTIIALPPNVDKMDCHGCPYRFRDEGSLRQMLAVELQHPLGADKPKLKLPQSDIEDIVVDARAQHYTRACYKYFVATHPECRRDSLFRSPFEYFVGGSEYKAQHEKLTQQAVGGTPNGSAGGSSEVRQPPKRTMMSTPTLQENVTKHRTE